MNEPKKKKHYPGRKGHIKAGKKEKNAVTFYFAGGEKRNEKAYSFKGGCESTKGEGHRSPL